jgi:arabinogalactan oligomer/maltooligosaccharide transport system permease protein
MEPVTLQTEPAPAPQKPAKVRRMTVRDRVARFSGTPVLIIKIALLMVLTGLAVSSVPTLVDQKAWPMLAYIVGVTVLLDVTFLWPPVRRAIPPKYFVPGVVFLIAFQLVPIVYTTMISFTNYSTGHTIKKNEAIPLILDNSLDVAANGSTYEMRVAVKDTNPKSTSPKDLALLLVDDNTNKTSYGTLAGQVLLKPGEGTTAIIDGTKILIKIPGYKTLTDTQVGQLGDTIANFKVPTGKNQYITPQGTTTAADVSPTIHYVASKNIMVRDDGTVYKDNGRGFFINPKDKADVLLPGWHVFVGFENYTSLLTDPNIRADFIRVFAWNVAFAFLSVMTTFLMGLVLALVFMKPLRGKRTYRSLMVLPYAIPAFISILVWAGLLNDQFGAINAVLKNLGHLYSTFLSWFGIHQVHTFAIPWLQNPWWARVSILLVNLWLGFPYFFLVCTGALTSIPADLTEAASVDGATPRQSFRKITLPLLLVAVGPLLVASFSYNFNNFGMIYLLTGGGPIVNPKSVAGATDILISYTYKLAFTAGKGQQYGLASAVSILIFFLVAGFSVLAFRRTRALEDTNR